jgi:transposase
MKSDDARKDPSSLHERRRQVVRLHKKGHKTTAISDLTGLSWGAVNTALKLYKAGGMAALEPKKRGRKAGSCRHLTPEQENRIQKLICDKRPEQLKMKFALWTRGAVKDLIFREFSLNLSIRCVGDYLHRWGFTPQKPIKRAYEQQPAAVQQWLDEEYPQIEAKALEEKAEIHWGDETSVVNTDVRGRSYAPRGKTPETRAVWGSREKFSMISTVTNQGKCRWMIIDGAFNSERLIEFMEQLIKDAERKVFLILDNLRVHHSKPVKEWVDEHQKEISLFFLPSYSPELNPDERLNADLKHKLTTEVPARTRNKLLQVTRSHMEFIQASPERVKSYFQDPHVRYAAGNNN